MFEIYRITNTINNKCYVGQTKVGYFKRFQQHRIASSIIGRAIRKYGEEAFVIEVLATTNSQEKANELEHMYILESKCVVPKGYNANEHGRLMGNTNNNYSYISITPEYYNEVTESFDNFIHYLIKIMKSSNNNFILKKNHNVVSRTWNDVWSTIRVTKRSTQQTLKGLLLKHDLIIIEKTEDGKIFKLNKDKFKIMY